MAGYELVSLITGAIKWVDAASPFVHVRRLRGHSLAAPVVTAPALLCRLGFHSWKERRNPEAARTVSALGAGSRATSAARPGRTSELRPNSGLPPDSPAGALSASPAFVCAPAAGRRLGDI